MAKLSGLLRSALSEPDIRAVLDAARDARDPTVPALRIEGPPRCARSWPPAWPTRPAPTAPCSPSPPPTGRPPTSAPPRPTCSDRTPSRCCPAGRRCRTSGSRRARTPSAGGCRSSAGWPTRPTAPRVVVAAARSLIQPIAPGLGRLDPVGCGSATPHDFDALLERLVELAYTRVEMVTARGEFAVRGGIVDIFPPTAEHPVRVEFWGDEVSELRSFAVADQRSVGPVDEPARPGLPGAAAHRAGPRAGPRRWPARYENNPPLRELLEHLAEGIPAEGMESLIPVLAGGELELLTDLLPAGALVLLADPERIRTRSADLVRTGQEFLAASWFAAGMGGAAPDRRRRLGLPRPRPRCWSTRPRTGRPVLTLSPLVSGRDDALAPAVHEVESYRGDTDRALVDLRAHVATGGTAVLVVGGHGTAQRSLEQLREADVPAELVDAAHRGAGRGPGHGDLRAAHRRLHRTGPAGGAQRGRPDRQPGRRRGPQAGQPPAQRRRPGHAQARRPRRALPARHRPVRRDARAHGRRRHPRVPGAGVRQLQARPARRPAVRAHRRARRDQPLRRRRGADAEQARRRRLGQDQGPRAQGRPADRRPAGAALRGPPGRAGARVRRGHPVAARAGGRVPVHRDARPAGRDRRGQGRHGTAGADGPGDLRRRRVRQDRDRGARGVQGRAGRQAGRRAGADHAAGHPAPGHVHRADARVPGHRPRAVPVHRPGRVPADHRGPGRRHRRRRHRHPPAAADRGALEGPRPGHRRRGAALRRRAQGAHHRAAHARGRAHAVGHPDPAHAGDEPGRHPRDVDDHHPARGPAPDADLRRRLRRQAGGRGDPPRAAARRPGVLRAQPGVHHRPGGATDPRAGARGPGRGGARADERGPAGAHRGRVLAQRVRRAGLHDDRGERAGHLQRQHADRRALATRSGCPSCTSCAAGSAAAGSAATPTSCSRPSTRSPRPRTTGWPPSPSTPSWARAPRWP